MIDQKPTKQQIAAVQRVLYRPARVRQLDDLAQSIGQLMNLDPTQPLQTNDVRNPPGSGPQWFYPDTGAVDQNVLQAAKQCATTATVFRTMRAELAALSLPAADKQHLMGVLAEQAAAWSARGALWQAPGKPANVDDAVAGIAVHLQRALAHSSHVQPYLKTAKQLGLK